MQRTKMDTKHLGKILVKTIGRLEFLHLPNQTLLLHLAIYSLVTDNFRIPSNVRFSIKKGCKHKQLP